jgi:hypothetical protein
MKHRAATGPIIGAGFGLILGFAQGGFPPDLPLYVIAIMSSSPLKNLPDRHVILATG